MTRPPLPDRLQGPRDALRIVAFHKPRGVVVSRVREAGSPTVFSLLPEPWCTWWCVGRLDKDSTGLLLLSNSSALAQRLMDPGTLAKRYVVTVQGLPTEAALDHVRSGGILLGSRLTRPAAIEHLGKAPRGGTRLEVVLNEGINRQIRRVFALAGHRVRSLTRTAVGPISLGDLPPGAARELGHAEVRSLLSAIRLAGDSPTP